MTTFFSGFGRRYWKGATVLEVFKFSLYLTIPLATSVFYANPDFMHWLIVRLNLVHYPKSVQAPPTGKEFENLRQKMLDAKKAADVTKREGTKTNHSNDLTKGANDDPKILSPSPSTSPSQRNWWQWL